MKHLADTADIVTEDYSEYESVDEEELEDPKPRRGKKAVTKDKKVDAASKEENSPAAVGSETKSSKPKPLEKSNSRKSRSSGPVKRSNSTKSSTTRNGSLMSFFEKK